MQRIQLGSTGMEIEKNGFGALPIQRDTKEVAVRLLRRAYEGGMNYFDTARSYTDSEEKVGIAFKGMRDKIFIATKTAAKNAADMRKDLETSLRNLQTDHIDVYQFHNPPFCPKPGGEDGLYDEALMAQAEGKIRFISITNHRLPVAQEAIASGLYATLQFPYSYLSGEKEEELIRGCKAAGMGFLAMKGLSGGLIRDGYTAAAFMETKPDVVPLWGVQHDWELEQFLDVVAHGAELTPERLATIEKDRKELSGDFCRSCGYCMPCPVGIQIHNCARIMLMLRRAPMQKWVSEEWQAEMHKIENCLHCYQCASKCPFGLDTPRLLQDNYDAYWKYMEERKQAENA
ncbi:MAG: aldo/keto reductase [Lachnospiraceae bacterium]|nr:aldo/keto reductase [Lachnospiraceae bacterium]